MEGMALQSETKTPWVRIDDIRCGGLSMGYTELSITKVQIWGSRFTSDMRRVGCNLLRRICEYEKRMDA
jgi:hypothetical protein